MELVFNCLRFERESEAPAERFRLRFGRSLTLPSNSFSPRGLKEPGPGQSAAPPWVDMTEDANGLEWAKRPSNR